MHTTLPRLLAPLALAAMASAQNAVFVPDNAAIAQPSSSTGGWRSSTTGFRTQFLYDTSHFVNQGCNGPVLLTRMRFRAANNSTSAGGTYTGNGTTTGVSILIGTSKTDYLTPSTTFGFNQASMQQVMANGTVTVAAGGGATPNNYVIDIAIPGGFVYDPTAGNDLLVDIEGPAFTGTLPTLASGTSLALSRCTRISSTPQTAATGTITSGFGTVILFDVVGGGSPLDPNGNPILVQATSTAYGAGCGPIGYRSFAELFPVAPTNTALDLGAGITLVPDVALAPTAYVVTPGAGAIAAHGPTKLLNNATTPAALTDDSLSQACVLGFTFPYPGGSTTVVHADTNGYIVLGTTTETGGDTTAAITDLVGTTAGVHAGLPRLCPMWYDLHPTRNTGNPAAGLYFDVDTVNQRALITYDDFGEFATSTAGSKSFNFQIELRADGTVEYRYGAMSAFGSTTVSKLVGFSPGTGSLVFPSTDLSVAMPFATAAAESGPLSLSSLAPRIGMPATFTTRFVPATPGVALHFISTVQFAPGLDLGQLLAAPSCFAHLDPGAAIQATQAVGAGTIDITAAVPFNVTLIGQTFYSQSAALAPGFNPGGVVTSNGLTLVIGTVL